MNKNNDIANAQEDNEYERQSAELGKRWDARLSNIDKMTQSMKVINDHYLDGLPTFIFRRYQNGEFGDLSTPEGKKDAKLRMAYFMINGVGTALQNASATIKGGQMQESDIEKLKNSQMSNALENRWNKYKQETQSAIDLAKQGGMSEEAITDSIATISSNNRLQSAFNQMNERQKVFALNVLAEVGDKLGNMNDTDFANTLMGMSAMGESLDYKEAAGMLIYRFIKDPEKRSQLLSELGIGNGKPIMAGFGLGLGGNEEGEKDTGVTLDDGSTIDPGKAMSKEELAEVRKAADNLSTKYYNGEITEEQFRKDYAKLEDLMSKHGIRNFVSGGIRSADDMIKENNKLKLNDISSSFEELNSNAGSMSPSDYNDQFENLLANAKKWGASEKELKNIEKKRLSKEKILKAAEKKNKKK